MDNPETTAPAIAPENPGTLRPDEIVVSVLETDANGVRIKLWPDVQAVERRLEDLCGLLPADQYSVRRYVCGRALYCAIALDDATRDAPCPAVYQVHSDVNTNEADGSFVAAAAAWGIGAGVFRLPPLRIGSNGVRINPVAGRDGKSIHHYELADTLEVTEIKYADDGRVTNLKLRRQDGKVIVWAAN